MRKIALGMAVAASAIAAPALARDGQAYVEADIGAIIENEFDVGIEGGTRRLYARHDYSPHAVGQIEAAGRCVIQFAHRNADRRASIR